MLLELQIGGTSLTVSARQGERTAMPNLEFKHALIVGAGAGLSASLARALAQEGLAVSLAARSTDDLAPLAQETRARAFACDASKPSDVERLFGELDAVPGAPDLWM